MGDSRVAYSFYELLNLAYVNNHEGKNISNQLTPFLNEHVKLRIVPKGGRIHAFGDTVRYMYVSIYGEYCVLSHTFHGQNNVLARRYSPQLLGISEVVNGLPTYEITIIALTECILLEVEKDYFINEIIRDGRISIIIIKNLTEKISMQSKRSERLLFYDSTDNLLIYIYQKWLEAKGNSEKLQIDTKRNDIADELGVNVRTLFRCLDKLKSDGLILIVRGKITVSNAQINQIKKRITGLI